MAIIHNPKVIQSMINEAKIQTSHDRVARELAEKVVPVLVINPKDVVDIVVVKSKTTTGTITAYTTPLDRDFYLDSLCFNYVADAANTGTALLVTVDMPDLAIESEIISINKVPSVAASQTVFCPFPRPILLKRGGNIKMTQTYAAGTGSIKLNIVGHTGNID